MVRRLYGDWGFVSVLCVWVFWFWSSYGGLTWLWLYVVLNLLCVGCTLALSLLCFGCTLLWAYLVLVVRCFELALGGCTLEVRWF